MAVIERGKYHLRESLANGKKQLTIGITPIHYQDDQGAWQPINTDWVDSGIGARPTAVTAAGMMVSVADDGLRRLHPTRDLNKYIEIGAPYIKPAVTWNKVNLGSPTRSGHLLTWTTANANAYCWHGGHFVKLGFLLKGGWTPPNNQFVFPVGINGLTRSGSNILDGSTVVAKLTKPVVYDLDHPEDVRDITFSFTSVTISGSSQPVLLMTLPDLTGMSRPLVDPTLTLQPDASAGMDTQIAADSTAVNGGTSALVTIGEANFGSNATRRGLFKFPLDSLPSTAVITSATLSLYASLDFSDNARTMRVYRQKRAWLEGDKNFANDSPASGATWIRYDTTNNWQTQGGFGVDDCEQTDIGSRSFTASETLNVFKDISLTPTTKADLDLGNGFLLKMDTESNDAYSFASSDDATAANRPKLVIVYADTIQPGRIESTATVYTPKLVHTVKPGRIESTTTFYTPKLTHTVKPGRIESTATLYAPKLVHTVKPGRIESTATLYAPKLVHVLKPGFISSGSTVYAPSLVSPQYIQPGRIESTAVVYAPRVRVTIPDPMCITVSDAAQTTVTLSDQAKTAVTLTDQAQTTIALSDASC